MDKELDDYMDKCMTALEEKTTRALYMSVIIGIIYTIIKYCIVGIILFAAGRYLGVW